MALVVRNLPANARDIRDTVLIPGSGRFPGAGNGDQLHCSCLENPTDRQPGGLQSTGSQRVRHNCSDLACMHSIQWVVIIILFSKCPQLSYRSLFKLTFVYFECASVCVLLTHPIILSSIFLLLSGRKKCTFPTTASESGIFQGTGRWLSTFWRGGKPRSMCLVCCLPARVLTLSGEYRVGRRG